MASTGEMEAVALVTELLMTNATFMKKTSDEILEWDTKEKNNTMIISLSITVFAVMLVSLRMYARIRQRAIGIEDWFAVAGTVFTVGHCGIVMVADLYGGVGRPAWSTSVRQFSMALRVGYSKPNYAWAIANQEMQQMMFWSFMTYPTMMGLIRASILLFYRRLFGPTHPTHQLLVRILLALLIPATIIFSCLSALMCTPIQAAWNPWERAGTCKDMFYQKFVMAMYATSLAFDVIILLLPLRAVWQLQLPNKQKLGVAVMLLCGSSACIAVIGRIVAFQIIYKNIQFSKIDIRWIVHPLAEFLPPAFDKQDIGYWIPAQVEPCVALIGSSLPSLRYYFSRSSTGTSASGSGGSGGSDRFSGKGKKQFVESATDSTSASIRNSTTRDVENPQGLVTVNLHGTTAARPNSPPTHQARAESAFSNYSTASRKAWYRLNPLHRHERKTEERDGNGIMVTTSNTTTVTRDVNGRGVGRPRGYEEWRLSRNSPVIYTPSRKF
ncbi:hypothetical protein BJ508DRAFT_133751 [Ascobolus immersus RN42]|uniref:Rhodopsin domain-containing protein n=1 Tax=Ascobolus immersus RN42 TaxID=1160509 RepID=A0A3N4IQD4_ASCIM|nr:hypothetical protein BJ508DRAFT_133751 [Ascobolus immersus RN42]